MRSEMLDADVERLSSGDKMSLEYLDAAIRARRYTLVIDALEAKIVKDYGNVELNNRLIFAYVMTSQTSKAISFLGNVKKFGKMDGYTYAMASIVSNETANDAASDELIKEAILNSPDSLGIRTAQAFIALKRDNPTALGDAAKSLAKEVNRSEAHYFMAALNNRLGRVDQGRRSFEKALKADAIDHDMYVEQGNEAISLALMKDVAEKDQQNQFEYARTMYELALKCRENSGQALSGMSIVLLMQKKVDESVSYAEAATKATPLYAGAWYTLSAAMSAKRLDARTALAKASQLDARNLQGRSMPDAKIVFRYFNTTGRTPVVSPPARG
jgi:tetratricopeptide (TPR) repeat protein